MHFDPLFGCDCGRSAEWGTLMSESTGSNKRCFPDTIMTQILSVKYNVSFYFMYMPCIFIIYYLFISTNAHIQGGARKSYH